MLIGAGGFFVVPPNALLQEWVKGRGGNAIAAQTETVAVDAGTTAGGNGRHPGRPLALIARRSLRWQ